METRFYCESCGRDVAFNKDTCPYCGNEFSDVKCPVCGLIGQAKMFLKGCPSCGFNNASAGADNVLLKSSSFKGGGSLKKKKKRPFRGTPQISVFWFVIAFFFISLLIAYLWVRLG